MAPQEFRRVFFPYCMFRLECGRYVVLNRNYKPLGLMTTEWVDYAGYSVKLRAIGPARARRLSYRGSEDLDRIYLYNNGCPPTSSPEAMASYQEKLRLLAKLEVG